MMYQYQIYDSRFRSEQVLSRRLYVAPDLAAAVKELPKCEPGSVIVAVGADDFHIVETKPPERRRRGPKPKPIEDRGIVTSMSLHPDVLKNLKATAEEKKTTVSALVNQLAREYFENNKGEL